LLGIKIDYYVAMNLDGIRVLNDMAGGVTVTLEDDFSALDPAMKKGATLTLQGEQAEIFVRTRWNIGVGTNEARMERQSAFLQALREMLNAKCRDDHDFPGELYDALEPYLETDMKRGRIINEVWRTRDYSYAGIVRPAGQYLVGENGFMEFHADAAALRALVMDLFYRPV
jgi:anionic cell wall polymer biosynthesis LytR-Cps2A-Psr (LCP) family protein